MVNLHIHRISYICLGLGGIWRSDENTQLSSNFEASIEPPTFPKIHINVITRRSINLMYILSPNLYFFLTVLSFFLYFFCLLQFLVFLRLLFLYI